MKRMTMILAVSALSMISARGQGFMNLDFESAQDLTNNPGHGVFVAATNALPGWTAYNGANALSSVTYVSNFFGGASSSVELEGGSLALNGDFSLGLFLGGSISQTAMVPGNAESLRFDAYVPGSTSFEVALGGQNLPLSALSQGTDYSVYGANIPAGLVGQMETLTFLIQGVTPGVLLDNIEFSSVPEPSVFSLILIGSGLLIFARARRHGAFTHPVRHGLARVK